MTVPAFRRTVPIVALFLTVIMVIGVIAVALAQVPPAQSPGVDVQTPRADTRTEGYGQWGLIGLLGLLGLAGLIRRDRTRPRDRPRA